MITKEKTLTSSQLPIYSDFEKIANQYGEKFIAERIGYYMLEYTMISHNNPSERFQHIGCTLSNIRINLLSYFNRPGSYLDISNPEINADWKGTYRSFRRDITDLLNELTFEMVKDEETEGGITRKDIDFLLDLVCLLNKHC